jgi:hypothetical protein
MDPRAKHTFQTIKEHMILIEILTEIRSRLLSMDQTHLHTSLDELGDESQKRLFLFTHLNIKVFDVSSANPKSMLHRSYP